MTNRDEDSDSDSRDHDSRDSWTLQRLMTKYEVLQQRLNLIERAIKERLDTIDGNVEKLITRPEFTPVKLLTYGLAGSLLAGIVAALLSLVVHK